MNLGSRLIPVDTVFFVTGSRLNYLKMLKTQNQLLTALPEEEYQRLSPHLQNVSLKTGQVLYDWEGHIDRVYFPNQTLISHVLDSERGETCEVGLVGNEGMVGIPVILGCSESNSRSVVQISGSATALNADILKIEFNQSRELHRKLLLYTQSFFVQIMNTVMYSSLHTVEERFVRWLLLAQNCTQLDELPLTQEAISNMLGTRRASITEVAFSLSKAGLIRYRRGRITLTDREGLEAKAGKDYRFYQEEYKRLLGTSA